MSVAYFDCTAGASGNMVIGALLDAGLDATHLENELRKLKLPPWELVRQRVQRGSLSALYADFATDAHSDMERTFPAIDDLIASSTVGEPARTQARDMFRHLAEAEASMHGVTPNEVHFHEIGAVDSVLDIVGAAVAFHLLGIDAVHVSAINVGGGTVLTQHGELPVPAPATLALLEGTGAQVYSTVANAELLTPTGALILTSFAHSYGPLPPMQVASHGHGAGKAELPFPNILRVILGESLPTTATDQVVVVETDIDDMNPELFMHVSDRLFAAGALDVTTTSVGMKKGRTGTRICTTVLPSLVDVVVDILLRETTTLGVRMHDAQRRKLPRLELTVGTVYGQIAVKASYIQGRLRDVAPEADACRQAAVAQGIPMRTVYDAARAAGLKAAPTELQSESAEGATK